MKGFSILQVNCNTFPQPTESSTFLAIRTVSWRLHKNSKNRCIEDEFCNHYENKYSSDQFSSFHTQVLTILTESSKCFIQSQFNILRHHFRIIFLTFYIFGSYFLPAIKWRHPSRCEHVNDYTQTPQVRFVTRVSTFNNFR